MNYKTDACVAKNSKAKENVNKKIKVTLNFTIMVAYFFLTYMCFRFILSLPLLPPALLLPSFSLTHFDPFIFCPEHYLSTLNVF